MKTGLLIDWQTAGALLANSDDSDQAAFFKAFVKELHTWPTRHQSEMQLCAVASKLTPEEINCLSTLTYKEKSQ